MTMTPPTRSRTWVMYRQPWWRGTGASISPWVSSGTHISVTPARAWKWNLPLRLLGLKLTRRKWDWPSIGLIESPTALLIHNIQNCSSGYTDMKVCFRPFVSNILFLLHQIYQHFRNSSSFIKATRLNIGCNKITSHVQKSNAIPYVEIADFMKLYLHTCCTTYHQLRAWTTAWEIFDINSYVSINVICLFNMVIINTFQRFKEAFRHKLTFPTQCLLANVE